MGFSSLDDYYNETTVNGKRARLSGNRTIVTGATSVAGRWHECFSGTGTGGAGTVTGTAGTGVARASTDGGCIPQANATVSTDTKHLSRGYVVTPATTAVPGSALLIDLLYLYPSCVVTGTPSTISNAAGKPTRHNNGAGVQLGALVVGALGAATPTLTFAYVNQSGTGGRSGTLSASANSLPAGALLTNALAANLGGPYMNLQAGDSGVRELTSYTIASGTTGTVTFFLFRPIIEIPLIAANTPGERDLAGELPPIDDDAHLVWLVNIGGALTASQVLYYALETKWG